MAALDAEFDPGEVEALAVNYGESLDVVLDFISDTGIRSPVLLDSPESAGSCLQLPPQEESLYAHFFGRVGSDDPNAPNPPFPLQVVLDSEGLIVHIGQSHQPDLIVQKLRELLTP